MRKLLYGQCAVETKRVGERLSVHPGSPMPWGLVCVFNLEPKHEVYVAFWLCTLVSHGILCTVIVFTISYWALFFFTKDLLLPDIWTRFSFRCRLNGKVMFRLHGSVWEAAGNKGWRRMEREKARAQIQICVIFLGYAALLGWSKDQPVVHFIEYTLADAKFSGKCDYLPL